jgi:TolB-like protein/Tfp pilus assembly protein PilF
LSLFSELRRRNVFRVGIAYLVSAWLLIQVAETIFPLFGFDDTPARLVVIVLAIGFIPALVFAWLFELTPEGLKQEKDVKRDLSVTRVTGRKLDRAIILVLFIALSYFVIDKFYPAGTQPAASPSVPPAETLVIDDSRELADRNSIAVLPFTNMSGDEANEPFTQGIHDDLLTHLSRIKSLKTISRTSVLQYRQTTRSIPEIAAELGVKHILEGGIQRSGDRIRVNLQLIDAATDEHLWAEIYDRTLTADNLFDIQGEIAEQVTRSLRATLLPEEQSALRVKPTHSMAAYDLYLLGRHHWNERTAESIAKARDFFKQAIEVDPNFVLAYSGLADAYSLLISYGNMKGEDAIPLASQAIDKAMSLNDSLSEVWASKGLLYFAQNKHPESAKALTRAIELDPQNFSAWLWYGNALGAMRRFDEQLAALETAYGLEPMSRPVNNNLALIYRNRGDFERGLQHLDRLIAMEQQPTESRLMAKVNALFWSGDLSGAVAQARAFLASNPASIQSMTWLIDAYIALGDFEAAETWVQRASTLDQVTPLGREVYEARGDFEGAIRYMEEKRQHRAFNDLAWYYWSCFRYAYLAGNIESAWSYFREYTGIVNGFSEINPSDSWQRSELRIAWFLINHSGDDERQRELGRKMLTEALATLSRLKDIGYEHPGTWYGLSMAWAMEGDREKALLALEKAVDKGLIDSLNLATEPALSPLRSEPRYAAAVRRMEQRIANENSQLATMDLAPFRPVIPDEAIDVPLETLKKYTGYYTDGSIVINVNLQNGNELVVKTPDQMDVRMLASSVDNFYAEIAPGYGLQFFTDDNGEVSHVMARGGGGPQRFKPVSAPPQPVELTGAQLKRYEGTYLALGVRDAADGKTESDIWTTKIEVDQDNRAWIHLENQAPLELKPYSETEFFIPGRLSKYRFEVNPINGSVERLVQTRDGNELEFRPQPRPTN